MMGAKRMTPNSISSSIFAPVIFEASL